MNRRSYCLALGSAGLAGLSGCLDTISGTIGLGSDGYIRPDDDPDTIPAGFTCDNEEFEPHWRGYSQDHLYWGDVDDYSLRVNALEFEYGETAEIELSADDRGSDNKWNLEILTENGWRDVRGTTDEDDRKYLGYDDIGLLSDAEWRIELTEDGIIDAGTHQDKLDVCPDLVSARYRFVYWGIGGVETADGWDSRGVTVAFDIGV